MKAFRKIKCTDREVDQLQTAVAQVLVPLSKNQFIDGVLIKDVSLSTGNNKIDHLLRRQPNGWLVVDQTAASDIYRSSWDETLLELNSSAATTVAIWVF